MPGYTMEHQIDVHEDVVKIVAALLADDQSGASVYNLIGRLHWIDNELADKILAVLRGSSPQELENFYKAKMYMTILGNMSEDSFIGSGVDYKPGPFFLPR